MLAAIIAEGIKVTRDEVCDDTGHGPFVRRGWLWGNWITLAGTRQVHGPGFSEDAGCPGCAAHHAELRAKHSESAGRFPVREFEVRSAAICADHGKFIFEARLCEYGAEYKEHMGTRYSVSSEMCGHCESEMVDEMDIQDRLELSNEEMERGCQPILAAWDYASGRIDSSKYLSILQNQIIPDLRGKGEKSPNPRHVPTQTDQDLSDIVSQIGHLYPGNAHLKGQLLPQKHEWVIAQAIDADGADTVLKGTQVYADAVKGGLGFIYSPERFYGPEKHYLKTEWGKTQSNEPIRFPLVSGLSAVERTLRDLEEG